jgi:hypothetical protein
MYKTFLFDQYSRPEYEYLANNAWLFTEKVDGTNIRIMWDGESVTFGGKTDNAQLPGQLVINMQKQFLPEKFEMAGLPVGTCLYGEGYGGKIQKAGATYGPEQRFVLFDVMVGDFWLEREDIEDVGNKVGADVVPQVGMGTLYDMVTLVSGGIGSQWGDFKAEGLVARPTTELVNRYGERVITKLKTKDFASAD